MHCDIPFEILLSWMRLNRVGYAKALVWGMPCYAVFLYFYCKLLLASAWCIFLSAINSFVSIKIVLRSYYLRNHHGHACKECFQVTICIMLKLPLVKLFLINPTSLNIIEILKIIMNLLYYIVEFMVCYTLCFLLYSSLHILPILNIFDVEEEVLKSSVIVQWLCACTSFFWYSLSAYFQRSTCQAATQNLSCSSQ